LISFFITSDANMAGDPATQAAQAQRSCIMSTRAADEQHSLQIICKMESHSSPLLMFRLEFT